MYAKISEKVFPFVGFQTLMFLLEVSLLTSAVIYSTSAMKIEKIGKNSFPASSITVAVIEDSHSRVQPEKGDPKENFRNVGPCDVKVKETYSWARWIIIGGGAALLILLILPFTCSTCVRKETTWILILFAAVVCVTWVAFALIADSIIFESFKFTFTTTICS
jgi:hypothetical protein